MKVTTNAATPDETADIGASNDRLQIERHWVFPSTATVIDNAGGEPILTDGPFIESKEHLAGVKFIDAPDPTGRTGSPTTDRNNATETSKCDRSSSWTSE